jgi:hypothetical protein
MTPLTLTQIWIYPVKSLGGIRLKEAKVLPKGLQHDRRWMLISNDNRFMSQREQPILSLFKQKLVADGIEISFNGTAIKIDFEKVVNGRSFRATVWDDAVEVKEVSKAHSQWFSDLLKTSCKLVVFPEGNSRPVDTDYAKNAEQVSLADGFPFLIIGEASLEDLNSRLKEPVPMNRFRPNFVFSGGEPYEEEQWTTFTIGKSKFVGTKPCARCVLTTINQDTAEKGTEPLVTLSKYRRQGNKVLFGQNVLAINHYEIKEGDKIILE